MRSLTFLTLFFYSFGLFFSYPLMATEEMVEQLRRDLEERTQRIEDLDMDIQQMEEKRNARRNLLADLDKEKEDITRKLQADQERTDADLRALYRQRSSSESTMYVMNDGLREINNYEEELNTRFRVRREIDEAAYQSLLAEHRATANARYKELLDSKRYYEAKVTQLDEEIRKKIENAAAGADFWAEQILKIQTERHQKELDMWDQEDALEKLHDRKNIELKEIAFIYEHLAEEAPEPPPYLVSVSVRMEGRAIYGAHWEEQTEEESKNEKKIKKLKKMLEEAMAAYEGMKGYEEAFRQLIKEAERNRDEAKAKVESAESKKFYADLAADVVLVVATAGVMSAVSKTGTFMTHLASESMSYALGEGAELAGGWATKKAYEAFSGSKMAESDTFSLDQELFQYVRDRWQQSYDFHDVMNQSLRVTSYSLPSFEFFKKPSMRTLAEHATFSSRALVLELGRESRNLKRWGGSVNKKEVVLAVAGLGKDFLISYFFDDEIAEWKQKYLEAQVQINEYYEFWEVQNAVFRCTRDSIDYFHTQLYMLQKEAERREDKREFYRGFATSAAVKKNDRFEITLTFSNHVKPPSVTVGGKAVKFDSAGIKADWKGTFTGEGLDKSGKDPKGVPISVSAADQYDRQLDSNPETVAYRDAPWETYWNGYEAGPDTFHRLRLKSAGRGAILFLIDASGSMEGGPIESAKRSVQSTVKGLEGDSEVAVMSFSGCGGASILLGFTDDMASAASAVEGLSASGATPYSKAIAEGRQYLNAQSKMEPKRMIILSDGMETCQGNPHTAGTSSGGPWVVSR
ncbi:MAG: hypothetical protein A2Z83_04305 [Omnitrophica bacterium GWA2_52_8]|nr:MAG: hypothetical protein A2Z83_04305 [Omnitrophica bacterium GWA2_52_8]